MQELKHISFILDGNRRWAKAKGMHTLLGHKVGYELVKDITLLLPKYGIKYATYYMFSTENWNRSEEEVSYLLNLFRDMFVEYKDFMMKHGIRVIVIGDRSKLPKDIYDKISIIEKETVNNTNITIATAVSYGSHNEIKRAVQRIATDAVDKTIDPQDIDEELINSYLDTHEMPHPDAYVRTSEKRLSNFLLWQAAYSEIFFIDKFWPDFGEDDLAAIVAEFSTRKRRYGK